MPEQLTKKQNHAAENDMGTGDVKKLMLQLAAPAIVAQLINMLYNIVDRIYIGHIEGIGAMALTGVGLCMPVLMLISAFAMLAGAGGAPRAAIAMGQNDNDTAEKILGNCCALLVILAAVLSVVFFCTGAPLLRMFGASDNTLPYGLQYLQIYVCGSVFVMLVLGLNPFITTQGFAKFSMLTTVIGAVCNIVLDPILIFGLGMGVRGAAVATVVSQGISAVWVLHFLTGPKTRLKLRGKNMPIKPGIIGPCLALGISSFVMLSTESVLSICFNSSLARYGGDLAVGAMTILSSINQFVMLPLQGICQGGQPIMSYNFGAGKPDRVKQAFRCQFVACVGYSTVFWLVLMLIPQVFAGVFSSDAGLVEYTVWAMRIYLVCAFSIGFQISCQQGFMALGQAKISLLMACLRKLILLIPLIFILPLFFENKTFAVFLAEPVSDVIAATVTATVFFRRFGKILKAGPGGAATAGGKAAD